MSQYLTLQQAAQFLGVHTETVRRYIKQGLIKAYKPTTRKIYIKHEDLVVFVEGE